MKRVNEIYDHPVFQEKFRALQEVEKDRLFCKHTLEHLIDVARLMYIYALEHDLSISKELIYATALMHDIGRIDQIEQGTPHEKAGAALCDVILPDCGFSEEETAVIQDAILHHRNRTYESEVPGEPETPVDKEGPTVIKVTPGNSTNLGECNWDEEKMNLKIGN